MTGMLLMANLPALQVMVPLLGAPVVALLGRVRSLSWGIATLLTWGAFVVAILLLQEVQNTGTISYHMGGWMPPFGIEYRVDLLNAMILLVVTGVASVVMLFARDSVEQEIAPEKQPLFYTAYLLCLSGLLGIVITNDTFNIFVFLEISSLSMYSLIAMGKNRMALRASFQYLILGTIGATFILIGIGLLYMKTGTLNISDLGIRLPQVGDSRTVEAGFAFLVVGLSLKIALFPLHMWLPGAYAHAPSFASAFIAATATKVSLYVLIRIVATLFGVEFSFVTMPLTELLVPLSVAGILIGSLAAIFQTNLKKFLAWSSIAQVGYITLGIGLANAMGMAGSLTHIANHALAKGGAFVAVGCMAWRVGRVTLDSAAGLGRTMPVTSMAFVVCGLGLIGVPFTAPFVSKWMLLQSAFGAGHPWLAAVLLLSSLLAVIYVWRMVEVLYFREPAGPAVTAAPAPLLMVVSAWILVLGVVYFGFDTTYTADIALQFAKGVF